MARGGAQEPVFVLRDVLGWPAQEVGGALDTTVAAVKSGLQRARATLRDALPRARADWPAAVDPGTEQRNLLRQWSGYATDRSEPRNDRSDLGFSNDKYWVMYSWASGAGAAGVVRVGE